MHQHAAPAKGQHSNDGFRRLHKPKEPKPPAAQEEALKSRRRRSTAISSAHAAPWLLLIRVPANFMKIHLWHWMPLTVRSSAEQCVDYNTTDLFI
jgi:hypothetical protein